MGLSSMHCVLCSKTPLQVWLDGQLACLWGSAVWQRDFCLASRSGFWKLERQVTDVSNQKLMLEETSSTKSGGKRGDERKESPERQPGNPMEGCRAAKRQRPGLWTQDQAPSTKHKQALSRLLCTMWLLPQGTLSSWHWKDSCLEGG